eukprot:Colp12_sorted_trinity150504_noHs@8720
MSSDEEPDLPSKRALEDDTPELPSKRQLLAKAREAENAQSSKGKGKAPAKEETEDEEDDGDDDGSGGEELLEVEFEVQNPVEDDFHGLKHLLQQLLPASTNIDISDLSDLMIEQAKKNYIGSTIKVKESEDVYGILSVINVQEHKDRPGVKQLCDHLVSSCTDGAIRRKLQALFAPTSTTACGILFNERFVNIPIQLVPPLHKTFFEEVQWAVNDGEPFRFETLVVVAKGYKENEERTVVKKSLAGGRKREVTRVVESKTLHFINPEDMLFYKAASSSFM